jgi:lipoprotein signal peptidase
MSLVDRRKWVPAAVFFGALALGAGCDHSTKAWAESALEDEPNQSVSAIDPYVDLTLRYNEGTAFSFIRDLGTGRVLLGVLSLLLTVVFFVMAVRAPEDRWRSLGFGIIAGGAVGNGIDRVVRHGVIDFIEVHYPWGGSWPAFNVADALVVIGVAVLIIREWRKKPEPAATA